MKKLALSVLTLLSLSSNLYAANSLMSQVEGKGLTLITMTGVHAQGGAGSLFVGECPNGQAKEAFAFRALRADGDSATVAYEPKCNALSFNTLLFLPMIGSKAKIVLALGEGRPALSFRLIEQTLLDVDCTRSVVKGWVWDNVTLTCRDQKNPKAVFVFQVN